MSEYGNLVKEAKEYVRTIEGFQQKIAMLAVKACTIRHGGRSDGLYTIKDFAEDIGIHSKTLQNWVGIYRNVISKLPKEEQVPTTELWKNASKVQRVIIEENRSANKLSGIAKKKINKPTREPGRVKELFGQVAKGYDFSVKFRDFIASQRHLKHCLTKFDRATVTDEQWIDLMGLLDENSDSINDYLSVKTRCAS